MHSKNSFLQSYQSLQWLPSSLPKRSLEYAISTSSYAYIDKAFVSSSALAPVTEIITTPIHLYAVYANGIACAFNKFTGKLICELSNLPFSKVKTLYYNRLNQTLIVIRMSLEDDYNSLHCEYYEDLDVDNAGFEERGNKLFADDVVCSPGFIEFDETNKKILTKARVPPNYKVWSMEDYKLQLYMSHPEIEEIRFSLGYLIFLYKPENNQLRIDAYEIKDLEKTSNIVIDLLPGISFEFIELFNEYLIIKHRRSQMYMINLKTKKIASVAESENFTPDAFIFLSETHTFITLQGSSFCFWTIVNDTLIGLPGRNVQIPIQGRIHPEHIFLSKDQKRLYVYTRTSQPYKSKEKDNNYLVDIPYEGRGVMTRRKPLHDISNSIEESKSRKRSRRSANSCRAQGCIRVFPVEEGFMPSVIKGYYRGEKTHGKEKKVTNIVYDDFHNDIYVGHQDGTIFKWSMRI